MDWNASEEAKNKASFSVSSSGIFPARVKFHIKNPPPFPLSMPDHFF